MRREFGERVVALDPKGTAYTVGGGLQSMISRVFSGRSVQFIGQEFGTYSGIRVLHALREENRWHHYGAGTLGHPVKRRLKEMFCPGSEVWRQAVLARGRDLLQKMIQGGGGTQGGGRTP